MTVPSRAANELEKNYGLARYARGITNLNLGEFQGALRDFDAVIGWATTTPARRAAGALPSATWAATTRR